METVDLSPQDRARIDTLIKLMGGPLDVIVSCREAARLLGKTPATISTMIREKRLSKVTIDGSTGIKLSEIQGLI